MLYVISYIYIRVRVRIRIHTWSISQQHEALAAPHEWCAHPARTPKNSASWRSLQGSTRPPRPCRSVLLSSRWRMLQIWIGNNGRRRIRCSRRSRRGSTPWTWSPWILSRSFGTWRHRCRRVRRRWMFRSCFLAIGEWRMEAREVRLIATLRLFRCGDKRRVDEIPGICRG